MSKTLNELASDLKSYIIEIQSDAHNKGNLRPERYNNLKFQMNIAVNHNPHVIVNIGMSSAEFDLRTGDKLSGGLGPDERYVIRWLDKPTSASALRECWRRVEKNRGKAAEKYEV